MNKNIWEQHFKDLVFQVEGLQVQAEQINQLFSILRDAIIFSPNKLKLELALYNISHIIQEHSKKLEEITNIEFEKMRTLKENKEPLQNATNNTVEVSKI